MKNKKLLFKSGLAAFICLCFGLSFWSAVNFHLNLEWIRVLAQDSVLENMMYVHFADNQNDFGWFLYFSNWLTSKGDEGELFEISTDEQSGTVYECSTQVKWFYYDNERWERLWPIDQDTRSGVLLNAWLETTWWIYTDCAEAGYKEALAECEGNGDQTYEECTEAVRENFKADPYGYYWYIGQSYSWQNLNLIMWVNYNTASVPFISIESGSDLAPTFVRVGNKYPVGFIYDYNWWVGLAWCRFSGSSNGGMKSLVDEVQSSRLSEIFQYDRDGVLKYEGQNASLKNKISCEPVSAADSLVKIIVEWIMWIDSSWTGNAKFGAMGNSTDTKMQYFATKSVNNITMINYARRKAETLCRWKWLTTEPSFTTIEKDKIVCLNIYGQTVNAHQSMYSGKTLIVKGWSNVEITPDKDRIYDIFVDDWNLLVKENTGIFYVQNSSGFYTLSGVNDEDFVVINDNGFISNASFKAFWSNILIDYFGYTHEDLTKCLLVGLNCELFIDMDENWEPGPRDISDMIEYGNCTDKPFCANKFI